MSLGPDEHNFVAETTFTDVGLREGTEHKYRVRAIGAGETEGDRGKMWRQQHWSLQHPSPPRRQCPRRHLSQLQRQCRIRRHPRLPRHQFQHRRRCWSLPGVDLSSRQNSGVLSTTPGTIHTPQSVEPRIVAAMGGIIYGPYTGTLFASTDETDIEHIVARSEAHDSGLCMADAATRKAFASDLLNLTLASETVNRRQKVAK